jgi:hypothetical protein
MVPHGEAQHCSWGAAQGVWNAIAGKNRDGKVRVLVYSDVYILDESLVEAWADGGPVHLGALRVRFRVEGQGTETHDDKRVTEVLAGHTRKMLSLGDCRVTI